jgi:type IV pilus assembly protein PilC
MLEKVAEHYEAEMTRFADQLGVLLEPLIMTVLGLLVGALMLALYLPVFQLGQVI